MGSAQIPEKVVKAVEELTTFLIEVYGSKTLLCQALGISTQRLANYVAGRRDMPLVIWLTMDELAKKHPGAKARADGKTGSALIRNLESGPMPQSENDEESRERRRDGRRSNHHRRLLECVLSVPLDITRKLTTMTRAKRLAPRLA